MQTIPASKCPNQGLSDGHSQVTFSTFNQVQRIDTNTNTNKNLYSAIIHKKRVRGAVVYNHDNAQQENTAHEQKLDRKHQKDRRTVFVSERHDSIHVVGVVDDECGQIFDVHAYVRPLFHLAVNNYNYGC